MDISEESNSSGSLAVLIHKKMPHLDEGLGPDTTVIVNIFLSILFWALKGQFNFY